MKLTIFSDPHIGCQRRANTTVTSRNLLKRELVKGVEHTLEKTPDNPAICVGDFFDTYTNTETDLLEGLALAKRIKVILAGNHDVINDATRKGSLDVIKEVLQADCFVPRVEVGEAKVLHYARWGVLLVCIPHHSSQDLFEQALEQAYDIADRSNCEHKLLLLHCNYAYPEERLNDTTLNLTKEDGRILLDVFNYVLLGHDHTPASYHKGSLLVIGSVFPTSFGDISDKRYLEYDTETKKMTSHPIWNKTEGYETIDAEDLLEPGELEIPEACRFIDVVGTLNASDAGAFSRAVQSQLWGNPTGTQLIGVRNSTTIRRDISDVTEAWGSEEKIPLPEKLGKALEGTEFYSLWKALLAESQKESIDRD